MWWVGSLNKYDYKLNINEIQVSLGNLTKQRDTRISIMHRYKSRAVGLEWTNRMNEWMEMNHY